MSQLVRKLSDSSAKPRRRTPRATPLACAVSAVCCGRSACVSGALLLVLQSGAALAQSVTDAPQAQGKTEAVIVTGTRRGGLKASDSASPIQVLDSSSLERTGQPDLIQAMAQNLPSFTAQAVGGDTANLTLSARLRGLSPNDTLVLVNGKRRHTTSNLAVLGGPFQGGAATDLNFIPVAAIDHIEVLQDGAAAQYGSDAIAGVINIILKKDAAGGALSTSYGKYYDGGGATPDLSFNLGVAPSDSSFLNLSAETKYHAHSNRGAVDPRLVDPGKLAQLPNLVKADQYPYSNQISGDAAYHLSILALNAGADLGGGTELYGNATYGKKTADAFENYRTPDRLPALYPNGFSPRETINETDFGVSGGVKGRLDSGWHWDLSSTYGKDDSDIGVLNSGNISLFKDSGSTPTDFHAGNFTASQWTSNFDLSREFEIGWKTPLNVAGGLEYRRDTYAIGAGDAASRYKEGSQSYPGFLLTDAGSYARNDKSIYIDFSGSPIDKLKLDLAARYEKFSDFGSAKVGKLTGRYDFSPTVAIRSTISNGFRAPTMAEQYYSATNVTPTSAFVQLAPNSPGARLVGVDGLKPEKSQNYSIGLVLKPNARSTLTLDAYVINIHDRIVGSGSLFGSGGAINSPAVTAAILANGNVLDPQVKFTGINIFSNAVNTRNSGAEAVYTYSENYAGLGRVDWSAAGNYNKVEVRKVNQAPSQLLPQTLLDPAAISDLETASPTFRINLGATWKLAAWSVNLREAIYGPSSNLRTYDGSQYYESRIKTKALTDLEVSYRLSKALTLSVGANNLFNTYPDKVNGSLVAVQRANLDNGAVTQYPSFSPFGINGGYYYARANYTF
ncbi:TonB-dependent receptor plug domain-containing protein [Janthinobacterium agaricidamnosum]|uniref:TonB-dependent Receptor Plug domain protein n=1 Tax=Janthinobacterium agaricidamnosum NBRC 102515 = DSM 9628 TaxID=1349767 RepID=W0V4D3_9BURK|nr:TonB-dependent receptor [Janthinobacterium agaricidamnosum]CDG83694.1 tonB-dependent Receptor Plug domain protein [Janthinobacterium agaricidamnosum NBRC 102515 = DSM 9628]